ncbi:FYVE zinc finger [Macleaya cordata]|uniref:1-phosphatidylinositol-3-phosphate 5-kinase n=1 Tax=Macleaya cordata TaxID=56857 RepID=A0A200Q445_MACCD|nr:FYVE zinc finger [Macleaya cordata]
MDTPTNSFSDLLEIVKSWIPRKTKAANVSRDFWMPDHSCRVCYECDSQFSTFNRRHHCRLCGRVFCAKCTSKSIPVPSDEPKITWEERERIRVCNYCYKQWEKERAAIDNGIQVSSPGLSPSPSATSLVSSTKSSGTCKTSSTAGSMTLSTENYQHVSNGCGLSPGRSAKMESDTDKQDIVVYGKSIDPLVEVGDPSHNRFGFCMNRSHDENDEYGAYQSDSETRHFPQTDDYYSSVNFDEIDHTYVLQNEHSVEENINKRDLSSSPVLESLDSQDLEGVNKLGRLANGDGNGEEREMASSLYALEGKDAEPVDFENNGLLWIPPEPEGKEGDQDGLFDDDDDDDATGEWCLRSSSSLDIGEYRSRDRLGEEHKKAMKNVVDGHFRALIAQLLQVENLPAGEEDDRESWLDIITSLSWEAATLLKPDTSKGGGMDPGGYVKVKCLACGRRSESMVVKGVVCKKNVAHRRMTSKIEKPRFLILGGALEYQRVSNSLSSIDTLLQQEMDHLKMAVAKIDAHHPNVLLVEKTVSRFAQDYLHAKDIALVLNIKRPLLERIARCTGAQIVPSIDNLSSRILGYCDTFHVEKFLEEHGSAGQGGKKLVKTLMFFEGCPKPLGCTILLKGANGDELKKVKHVVQYGIFAAYHLALETSFLADEGASLPELPLKSPITVALPDNPSNIGRSISTIPGFTVSTTGQAQGPEPRGEPQKPNKILSEDLALPSQNSTISKCDLTLSQSSFKSPWSQYTGPASSFMNSPGSFSSLSPPGKFISGPFSDELSSYYAYEKKSKVAFGESLEARASAFDSGRGTAADHFGANDIRALEATGQGGAVIGNPPSNSNSNSMVVSELGTSELATLEQDHNNYHEEPGSSKEEFPQCTTDHQSILVSLSTRCVWKGTVCERAHLFRIKYYGSSDKPLGRFLRDHLFDQSYRCRLCEMPSEAHIHSYTHRQGTLTISVKKLPGNALPGEREGKIWMWHRCLRCPRTNGFPPATRRVVMSDAAWGLSFGKFLELSFSNHAAASRVANCGHSLHRDCLRFYGFGEMVACFRYASIDVHSVYLPPAKLDFNYNSQEWIQKEANEVVNWAGHLSTEVRNVLRKIADKRLGSVNSCTKVAESRGLIANLEGMLQKEKAEFEESLQKALNREAKKGQRIIDILEINRLRRQLIFLSYVWDQRLVYAASLDNNSLQEKLSSSVPKHVGRPLSSIEKPTEMNSTSKQGRGFTSCDSQHVDARSSENHNKGGEQPDIVIQGRYVDPNQSREGQPNLCTSMSLGNQSDPLVPGMVVHRSFSEGQFPSAASLSDTLDAAWTGKNYPGNITAKEDGSISHDSVLEDSSIMVEAVLTGVEMEDQPEEDRGASQATQSLGSPLPIKVDDNMEQSTTWVRMPFLDLYHSVSKISSGSTPKLDNLGEYDPVYLSSLREMARLGGARFFLPIGVDDTVVPVYDDEPTSIISYALLSPDYHAQISGERERPKDGGGSSVSLLSYDSMDLHLGHSLDEAASESLRSVGSMDESILSRSGSRSSLVLDPLLYSKSLHASVSFADDGPLGKVKYTVTCYYSKRFEALRRICCPSELDFIRSLSRCKKWGAQGGKSNVFFAKTLDDRFIIKQVTKTELESFIKFAPEYFKYLSESIDTRSPTCLAKILGIYQVTSKHLKGSKELRMDVLVMENLLFGRNLTRLYDLKGSSRSRYNPDSSGSNKVLLDQNLIEAMPTSPIFVGNKAKRLLERAVWNDTSFLASIDVMDYSLLVGVDEEKHELVVGIIDFMRQYTWDKHLETWVKASGILGGSKNSTPTVISPKQYKKRFRKAMSEYFLMVPDQWSPQTIMPSGSQSDLCEENTQGGTSLE